MSRRERKKAATRQAISDAALRLFLERGYEQVGIRDVAEAADVSTTTVFKHFTGKEALVFDQDQQREAEPVAVVRNRAAGQSVLDALRQYFLDIWLPFTEHPQAAAFNRLVDSTPELRAYGERMWAHHAESLAAAIAEESGVDHDDLECLALARFVLTIPALARARQDRREAVETIFALLTHGWRPPPEPQSAQP
ncbi:TetR family transcriptional regulator [Saccharopolyspora subtropica]|uniref:TetR family transcriptional regulator n=1 Tax=Saccharopolyspora thermophila TaxID=89367 RepID=A0A917JIP8_9PSEU|nr:TetR/AcrR family transcriptional regulator [Saccharopolyspora subtropica]GGI69165.1 TetR family transcriptional regulator [Saccharopolyspora subtropica]